MSDITIAGYHHIGGESQEPITGSQHSINTQGENVRTQEHTLLGELKNRRMLFLHLVR